MKQIEHKRYNDAGELVETFLLEYPENETKDRINLTDELVESIGKRMGKGESFNSYYGSYEKPVYFHGKRVYSMTGKGGQITITYEDGKKYVKLFKGE